MIQSFQWRNALAGAGITIGTLVGGIVLGIAVGSFIFNVLSPHSFTDPNPLHVILAAVPAFAGFVAGSAVWGVGMGRLAGSFNRKRMALAGALGFAPVTLALVFLLQLLEPIAVEKLGAQFPIHRLFTFFFVPTALIISGISAWSVGRGLGDVVLARRLLMQVAPAAALAFLTVDLLMESLGWQVGGPNAGERITMLTVLMAGNLGAAVVGGAVMGVILAGKGATVRARAEPHPV